MKKLTLLFVAFVSLVALTDIYSQGIPETINYQGILKDAAGIVVPNGHYNLIFKLYDAASSGTELWSETKLINVVDGIINAQLGSVTPIPGSTFDGAAWLGITVGSESELTPRIVLTSVPYSFMSMNVPNGSITSVKIADAEVVKSLNGLKDDVNLVAGTNVTITPSGNNLTINAASAGGTIGGSGTTNYIPLFTAGTTLGNSQLYQTGGNVGIGTTSPEGLLHITRYGTKQLVLGHNNQPNVEWYFDIAGDAYMTLFNEGNGTPRSVMSFNPNNGNVGIGTASPTTRLHISGTSPSFRLADGTQSDGKILVSDGSGNASWKDNSFYHISGLLNTSSVNLTSAWSSMGNFVTFTKNSAGSTIEVNLNSRVRGGTFSGATGAEFEVRIDGVASSISNKASVFTSGETEFISILAVFTGLSTGSHTVSVWARTNAGTSTGALLDPGGWGGKIIVKETF